MDNGLSVGPGTTYEERVSAAVKAAWEASGISLNGFATQSGIPRNTLRRKLDGHDDFRFGEVGKIAALLGVPLESLALPREDSAA